MRVMKILCFFSWIIFINISFSSLVEESSSWHVIEWDSFGFPQNIDRKAPLTEEQSLAMFEFLKRMKRSVSKGSSDEDIQMYFLIMKECLTPRAGDHPDWISSCIDGSIWSFANTRFASEFIPLLKPVLDDSDESFRVFVAYTLALFGDKSSIDKVLPMVGSENETTRKLALKTLKIMGYDVPVP